MFNKFLKNRCAFFMIMLAPLFQNRFYAIADDKLAAPGNLETRSSSILAEVGRMATNAIQNVLGVFSLNWNDTICNRKMVPIIYTRSSPIGDTDLGALPIGTWCMQYTITTKEISGYTRWVKIAAGVYGWAATATEISAKELSIRTQIVTAGNETYTAANLVNGFLLRDCTGGARSDVTPTAAQLLAQFRALFGNAVVGSNFVFEIANTSDAAETLTVTAGSGVTLWPASQTLTQNTNGRFRAFFTNVTASSEAVTIYKL